MEDKNQNIEELFRDTFSDYEEKVSPELWEKISGRLDSAPLPGSESGVSGTGVSGGAAFTSGIVKWVAIAALVAASGTGVYYLTSQNQSAVTETVLITPDAPEVSLSPSTEEVNVQTVAGEKPVKPETELSEKSNTLNSASTTAQELSDSEPKASASIENQINNTELPVSASNKAGAGKTETASSGSGTLNPAVSSPANPVSDNASDQNNQIRIKADQLKGHAPLTVNFRAEGAGTNLEWSFGDGSIEKNTSALNHTFTNPGEYQVTVKSTAGGIQKSDKITILVTENLDIQYIPNVFTPNGDAINDYFRFEASGFTEIEVIVIDQSGNQVAKFTDPAQGWDGNLKTGAEAKEGTYLYTIFATSPDGRKHQQKGWVRLIRKK